MGVRKIAPRPGSNSPSLHCSSQDPALSGWRRYAGRLEFGASFGATSRHETALIHSPAGKTAKTAGTDFALSVSALGGVVMEAEPGIEPR
jgi:hypothetical protein